MSKFAVTVVLFTILLGISSVQQTTNNLLETVRQGDLLELVKWLEYSGLNNTLVQRGPFTILAPSNKAFQELSPNTVWKMKSNSSFLAEILKYHLLTGDHKIADIAGVLVSTVQGEAVRIARETFDPNKYRVEQKIFDASVDFSNVFASNGVMHFIDRVLMPPSLEEEVSLEEVMRSSGQLTTFLSLAEDAGLLDTIRDGGPQTLFAPIDNAFQKVDASILRQLRQEPRLLKAVIRSHMMPSVVTSQDIKGDSVSTNSLGELVIFRSIGNLKLINTARMIATDILAKNGALHIIDSLLLPSINALGSQGPIPTMNVQSKLRSMGLTIFADMIQRTNMESILSGNASVTVFAPSNKAFTKLPLDTVQNLMKDKTALEKILKQHIVSSNVQSTDFKLDTIKNTLASSQIRLNTYKKPKTSTYTANGVALRVTDEKAVNGIIHVVDSILPATDLDVLDVLKRDTRFSTFLESVQASDLISTLRSEGPVTVFAPTNEAFQSLPPEEFFSALLDVRKLASIVSNHVATAHSTVQTIFSPGLCWRSLKPISENTLRTAMNRQGEILISSGNGKVAKVLQTDILAKNGVVHVVDNLL